MTKKVALSKEVSIIDLPTLEPKINVPATVLGWGCEIKFLGSQNPKRSDSLKIATLKTIDDTICKNLYNDFDNSVICAKGIILGENMCSVSKIPSFALRKKTFLDVCKTGVFHEYFVD